MSQTATVISGANTQDFDLPEEPITIAGVIERFATVMNIPGGNRQVLLNGKAAAETTIVSPGDKVEIVREAGSKG